MCIVIENALKHRIGKFVRVVSKKLVGMFIVVYAKACHASFIHDVSSEYVGTGILGLMGNKGGVGARFKIYDSFVSVVNSHLAADTSMVERRNLDFQEICRRMVFPIPSRFKDYHQVLTNYPWVCNSNDVSSLLSVGQESATFKTTLSLFDSDHLIWLGDLNYRVMVDEIEAKNMLQAGQVDQLLQYDQLLIERENQRTFIGFEEGKIQFKPTYKYDVGTSDFDTSEKRRAPSWCDRILWFKNPLHAEDPEWCKLISYDACMDICSSDHKPINSVLEIKVF